jgi:methionyl-tRNA formyltransferase
MNSQGALRILLFGDGAWATESLLRLHRDERWQVVGLVLRVTPSEQTLATLARGLSIPILQPIKVNAPEFLEQVKLLAPNLGLSISYNQILGLPLLQTAPLGFVNFHAGKLPRYRGRNVVNWAIINGETEIGLTAHFVDEGIDTGDVIRQHTLPIGWTDTYGDVLARLVAYFPDFVTETLESLVTGDYERRPQDPAQGTYFAGRGPGDEWLDWGDTSYNLHNKVRAISRPGPGARTTVAQEPVIVWRAFFDPSWPRYLATTGQVVGRNADGVLVKTSDSVLLLKEIEFGGSHSVTPHWPVGTRLGTNPATTLSALLARLKLIGLV